MSISQTNKNALVRIPDGIDSPEGKLLYLYLEVKGTTRMKELVTSLRVPRITAYSVLGTLENRGLVERVAPDAYRSIS